MCRAWHGWSESLLIPMSATAAYDPRSALPGREPAGAACLGHDDRADHRRSFRPRTRGSARRSGVRGADRRRAPGRPARGGVKFLIDAQLPLRLSNHLADTGHDSVHTSALPDGNQDHVDQHAGDVPNQGARHSSRLVVSAWLGGRVVLDAKRSLHPRDVVPRAELPADPPVDTDRLEAHRSV
jgi:hypothetical protein